MKSPFLKRIFFHIIELKLNTLLKKIDLGVSLASLLEEPKLIVNV